MRLIKLLGLTVVAAFAVTAFIGAGSASAWGFCKDKGAIPCEDPYIKGAIFTGALEGEKALFTGHSAATCKTATIEFELLSEPHSSPVTKMLGATFANCNSTVNVLHLPWEVRFLDISEGKGKWEATATEITKGPPGVEVGGCTYTTNEMHFTLEDTSLTGGAAKLRANVPLTGTCGSETLADTVRLSPSPLYGG
jgi:hypothetical protein